MIKLAKMIEALSSFQSYEENCSKIAKPDIISCSLSHSREKS
jgi:hypothetical protein